MLMTMNYKYLISDLNEIGQSSRVPGHFDFIFYFIEVCLGRLATNGDCSSGPMRHLLKTFSLFVLFWFLMELVGLANNRTTDKGEKQKKSTGTQDTIDLIVHSAQTVSRIEHSTY